LQTSKKRPETFQFGTLLLLVAAAAIEFDAKGNFSIYVLISGDANNRAKEKQCESIIMALSQLRKYIHYPFLQAH
jgi:hypothetical protein